MYAQAQYGSLARIDKKSGESVRITPKPRKGEAQYNFNWDAPLLISPHNHKTLYFASNKLFRSNDRGDSWEVISDDLDQNIDRNKLPLMGQWWPMDAVAKNGSTSRYGAVVSLDESRLQEGLIYAGSDDGQISITEDAGKNWRKINKFPAVPENTFVYDIIASKHNVNVVFAAFNNHKSGDFKPYVLKSEDKGRTWVNISSDLPERGSVYALEQDHKNAEILFAGTEFTVFISLNKGKSWKEISTGLPTINVRDMMIQERENDLVLATFGRGFYILHDYAPLRELNNELLDKEAHLFDVKDGKLFKTWRPLGGLGSKEKGFQGESFYTTANPERGVEFVSWIKDVSLSLKGERKKKEKEAFKGKALIPYPTLEEFKAEKEELENYLIYIIEDEQGNFVRELRAPLKKGLNKILWDMEYPSFGMVGKEDAKTVQGLPSAGIFVLPGKYQVSISKNVNGELQQLAGPEFFEIKELNNRSIPALDRKELVSFKQKALELSYSIGAVSNELRSMGEKIPYYKAAVKALPSSESNELFLEVIQLEQNLSTIQNSLNGDRDYATLDLDEMLSLRRRAGSAVYDIYNSTSNIPGAVKKNFEIASEEYKLVLESFDAIKIAFDKLEASLDEKNAPHTPGRMIK